MVAGRSGARLFGTERPQVLTLGADRESVARIRSVAVVAVVALVGLQLATTMLAPTAVWTNARLLFWLVVVAASLCVVTASLLVEMARRNGQPELGFVGLFFFVVSAWAVIHGLTVPGVVYDANSATAASVFWAIPAGALAMSPTILRRTAFGRIVSRHWLRWAAGVVVATLLVAAAMLASPNLVLVPEMGSTAAIGGAAVNLVIALSLGWRHVRLAEIAARPGPLVITVGFALVGTSALVFVRGPMFAPHFWLAHVLDIAGVFLATIGGLIVYWREGRSREVLAPIVALDGHAALEVGLSPLVHAFVADLDRKDQLTRDHVIRCAALAVDTATAMGLAAPDVRRAGLVGLLHDVGKLGIPDEILTKPGALTDDEFAVMKTHTTIGEEMLRSAPGLDTLAAPVASHHERFDGNGYPSQLAGDEIPLTARVVSACDAFDAITMTRHYREGRPVDAALDILRGGAGTQWDPGVVEALVSVASHPGFIAGTPTVLDGVGRDERREVGRIGCDCVPAGLADGSLRPTSSG